MIIWGSGSEFLDLGQVEVRHCPICERERLFKLFLYYKYDHIYYMRHVSEKKYYLLCDICRRGWLLNTNEVESKFERNPIPFMTRYGGLLLIGIFMVFILLVIISKQGQ